MSATVPADASPETTPAIERVRDAHQKAAILA